MIDPYAEFLMKVPAQYVSKVEDAISHAAQVLTNRELMIEECEDIERGLSDLHRTVAMDVADAWRSEILSRLQKRLYLQGVGHDEAEELLIPRATKLLENMEWCRNKIETVEALGPPVRKFLALKFAATAAAITGMVLFVINGYKTGEGISKVFQQAPRNGPDCVPAGRMGQPHSYSEFTQPPGGRLLVVEHIKNEGCAIQAEWNHITRKQSVPLCIQGADLVVQSQRRRDRTGPSWAASAT